MLTKKVKIPAKYLDFSNVFLEEKALVLPKISELNQHTIMLQKDKQLSYCLIYSLEPIEFETLKTYIETNLANTFIQLSKLP